MNPYSRFGLVSNTVSAAAILSALALIGPQIATAIATSTVPGSTAMWASAAGAVTVMVVFWLAMTEAIFPTLFRLNTVRRLILGKYYFEGTWLQSEKGTDHARLSVIDIQPQGKGFIFSGYSLNEALEIQSNTLIEFSKLEWPFMTYKYRNSLSDGSDGCREGVGEIQFEMNRAASQRYNGYVQYVKNQARLNIEGAKLVSNSEVKNLRTLRGRQSVFKKYWDLFFNVSLTAVAAPVQREVAALVTAPVIEAVKAAPIAAKVEAPVEAALERMEAEAAIIERRKAAAAPVTTADGIVPRRRTTDWSTEQAEFKGQPLSTDKTGTK